MSDAYPSLVLVSTATSGTGAYVLNISLSTGPYQTHKQAVTNGSLADGDVVHYMVRDATAFGASVAFENGEGIYTDAGDGSISRVTVFDSSNAGAPVSWPASGVRDVYMQVVPAGQTPRLDRANTFDEPQTIAKGASNGTIAIILLIDTLTQNPSVSGSGQAVQFSGSTGATNSGGVGGYSDGANKGAALWAETATGVPDLFVKTTGTVAENLENAAGLPYEQFAAGTKLVFYQASPPTGWTQDVTDTEAALRVVSGSGGGTGGSIALTGSAVSGAHAITIAQMPSHDHGPDGGNGSDSFITFNNSGSFINSTESGTGDVRGEATTDTTGGSSSHDHDIDLKFIDVITASKD